MSNQYEVRVLIIYREESDLPGRCAVKRLTRFLERLILIME